VVRGIEQAVSPGGHVRDVGALAIVQLAAEQLERF